jgi:hypothetical protein
MNKEQIEYIENLAKNFKESNICIAFLLCGIYNISVIVAKDNKLLLDDIFNDDLSNMVISMAVKYTEILDIS